jgi:hypothetical protein
MPSGGIFSFEGIGIFPKSEDDTWWLLGYLNSRFVGWYLNATCGLHKNPPYLRNVPVPEFDEIARTKLATWARAASGAQVLAAKHDERSPFFVEPLSDSGAAATVVAAILADIDMEVETWTAVQTTDLVVNGAATESEPEPKSVDPDDSGDDSAAPFGVFKHLSWLVGVSFARFDPRLATGERAIPPEPEPFDALPTRSPGMYPENEGPSERPDILVDDEGRADDIVSRVRAVADRVRVEVPENLRGWLAKDFFPLHIKMYSKNRRKAPIYWQLATRSASYSVWLYIHAFSKDTLFRVQNDYAAPKLAHEDRRLESLSRDLRDGAPATQRKALAAQQSVVEELRSFLDEVKRAAPLWNPNLDDGVVINFAPLWRLVPQNKAWQRELKTTWDALREGKHDWAHLAMHLWPERVIPRCAKDRSLAIAHGLEDVFWVETDDGKWKPRPSPKQPIVELVRNRTSVAVKTALDDLIDASTPSRPKLRRRSSST